MTDEGQPVLQIAVRGHEAGHHGLQADEQQRHQDQADGQAEGRQFGFTQVVSYNFV